MNPGVARTTNSRMPAVRPFLILAGLSFGAAAGCASTPRRVVLPECIAPGGASVAVIGAVRSPGAYRVDSLREALARAGGPTPLGLHVVDVRRRGCGGKITVVRVDIDAIDAGDEPDVAVAPGDIVFVPERDI
jgi:protein involved in polysaccharide export with SLBB domain